MAFKPFDLTGKAAVVTGGNGGIGLGMAEGLAAAGADVAIWGRNADKNAAALERLKAHGTRVEALEVDVADEQAVVDAMAESLSRLGRIDSCIANAGVGGGAPLIEQTTEQWRKVTAVNLDAVFWTFREAARHMVARAEEGDKGGSLLVTSSVSAIHGAPQNQAYAATKAGVLAMVRGTAVELARHGIRANAILPGWIATEMTERLQNWDAFNDKAIGRVPMRRWGEGEDFAGMAVYFASDASKFHTGDSVVIDGGYSIF
ncbi:SDR family NAD(P)-dependent oxidoreductase [Erythrobacter sp. HI0074]|uniref:SDR family NAD(P)-dependent oxidoreductase n=2 Tax=unclassified Erythrobacter TaxID=2633097 RepID=UPI0007B8F404|nr:SDR family oxidoreductase [Erythrobacter sp. HI0074]KZY93181.1 2-deoxy-D-gluconate 3-dehydrogenase [Erythrobacter sp. HI0074]|tara:strand:- start:2789 stop:3568 length:780 start_codon:yes stop_codon:yes gene_type:complete